MGADEEILKRVQWLGQAGFLIRDRLTIYMDPFEVSEGLPKADIIFLTHSHDSHCSEKDVRGLSTPQTVVAGPKDCVSKFRLNQMPLKPSQRTSILGISVRVVKACHYKEDSIHPEGHGWLGFVLDLDGIKIYHPGDSGWTDDMASLNLENLDVMFWPLVGRDVLGVAGIEGDLNHLKTKLVLPIHY